jgi:hypothetical protein
MKANLWFIAAPASKSQSPEGFRSPNHSAGAPPLDADKPGRVWRETGAEDRLHDIALRMLVQETHAAGQRIGVQTIVGVETHNLGGAGQ